MKGYCKVEGCSKPMFRYGRCSLHFRKWRGKTSEEDLTRLEDLKIEALEYAITMGTILIKENQFPLKTTSLAMRENVGNIIPTRAIQEGIRKNFPEGYFLKRSRAKSNYACSELVG